jgi:hypothetical protein
MKNRPYRAQNLPVCKKPGGYFFEVEISFCLGTPEIKNSAGIAVPR